MFISVYILCLKLYILTELSANGVKFISVDRQKLDLSIYIYLSRLGMSVTTQGVSGRQFVTDP